MPLLVNGKFITKVLEKTNLFNIINSKQREPLQNTNTLPKYNICHAENMLNNITFDNEKLLKIIQSLNANKAHGYDSISIRMLKLSSLCIMKLLPTTFSISPDDWETGNIAGFGI